MSRAMTLKNWAAELRWIIRLEWLKIEKSDVWISNYSVFLSDLSDLSPMLERLYKQVEQPSCSERKSAPITDHRSLPTNHRIIEEHQVEQARIFKRKRRVSTLNSRSSAFVTEQRFLDRIFCAQSIIFYQVDLKEYKVTFLAFCHHFFNAKRGEWGSQNFAPLPICNLYSLV